MRNKSGRPPRARKKLLSDIPINDDYPTPPLSKGKLQIPPAGHPTQINLHAQEGVGGGVLVLEAKMQHFVCVKDCCLSLTPFARDP